MCDMLNALNSKEDVEGFYATGGSWRKAEECLLLPCYQLLEELVLNQFLALGITSYQA